MCVLLSGKSLCRVWWGSLAMLLKRFVVSVFLFSFSRVLIRRFLRRVLL